ncbi:MAG: bifunctional oligoribonuclease/PAP phosphatase NrnA [Candidatus Riflebacteria bacterium]|nr:bifunctional oligoribonuclease/PAP phosphatase NrnA [Candidatus Riflebacteria bacterium]
MPTHRKSSTSRRLSKLREIIRGKKNLLVVVQDFPDPDAIGAAAALKELVRFYEGMPGSMACGGFVGRAENRALVKYLDLNLLSLGRIDVSRFDLVAMVDTQPGTGNNSLPPDITPDVVIDHHPIHSVTRKSPFHDVRSRYGATASILFEYLTQAGVEISVPLATALVYGIRSDTHDLGRDTTQADIAALLALYPLVNKRMLSRIEMERLPRDYFEILDTGLRNAKTQGCCVISGLGSINNPDMIGEVADLLLRNEESSWALCHGFYGGRMLISIRTSDVEADAGRLVHRIVRPFGTGGGHRAMAGAQIPVGDLTPREIKKLQKHIVRHFLKLLGQGDRPEVPLVLDRDVPAEGAGPPNGTRAH